MKNKDYLIGKIFGELVVIDISDKTDKHGSTFLKCRCSCGEIEEYVLGVLNAKRVTHCKNHKLRVLIGKTFGDWFVTNISERVVGERSKCYCLCMVCGSYRWVITKDLLNGKSKSCGCSNGIKTSKRCSVDEAGNTFGDLQVIERVGTNNDKKAIWKVRCSCGEVFVTSGKHLRGGRTKCRSCNYKDNAKKRRVDITGKKFGMLTAIKCFDENNYRQWLFMCDCGRYKVCDKEAVCCGSTKSCGCLGSYGESIIRKLLDDSGVKFDEQKTFCNCILQKKLKFDFYIDEIKTVIEFDGKQHFESIPFWGGDEALNLTRLKDKIKDTYCHKNNIKMLRISYLDINNIESILIINKIIKEME